MSIQHAVISSQFISSQFEISETVVRTFPLLCGNCGEMIGLFYDKHVDATTKKPIHHKIFGPQNQLKPSKFVWSGSQDLHVFAEKQQAPKTVLEEKVTKTRRVIFVLVIFFGVCTVGAGDNGATWNCNKELDQCAHAPRKRRFFRLAKLHSRAYTHSLVCVSINGIWHTGCP